jgi:hypothetical protein
MPLPETGWLICCNGWRRKCEYSSFSFFIILASIGLNSEIIMIEEVKNPSVPAGPIPVIFPAVL